jgi:hypothetical protein
MYSLSDRAAAYLEQMPPAIAGSGGHSAAFNAAAVLTRGFALPEEEALPLLLAWNQTHCQPPWRESELRRKLRSTASSSRPLGYLLNEAETFGQSYGAQARSDEEEKERQRKTWPRFKAPSPPELETLSRLRSLPGSALRRAEDAGLLFTCRYEQAGCFILAEGDFAQARRLDGQPLPVRDGHSKAKNLPGSSGAFIGAGLLGECPHVLLVEGCIGLLEALGCISLADAQGWTAIAATSAQSRLTRAPGLLASLAGRQVHIVPDADEAGRLAAIHWLAELTQAGVPVEAHKLPGDCKDLGQIVSDHLSHQPFLKALFA